MNVDPEVSSEKLKYFDTYSPWLKLDGYNWGELISSAILKKFRKNTVIFHQQEFPEYVYIIKKGRVRLSIYSENGDEKALTIVDEGGIFGESSVFDNLPSFTTATAVMNSEIYLIPNYIFKEIINKDTQSATRLIYTLVKKINILSSQVDSLSFRNAYFRVAMNLIKIAQEHGLFSPEGCKFKIKFTHQEMANLTGLCRVTVSNIMSEFQSDGTLYKDNGYFVIKDFQKLYRWLEEPK